MGEGEAVEFVGPSVPVMRWPGPSERGVIAELSDREDTVHILWERSSAVLAWPVEWVRKMDEPTAE